MTELLTITRTFTAPRELVFDVWTSPKHFGVWFGGEDVTVPLDSIEMDLREGGSWKATMQIPGGHEIHWVGEYVELDRPTHLVFTLTDDPSSDDRSTITVDLAESTGGTEMTMSQTVDGFPPEGIEQLRAGYGSFFDAIEKLLATLT